MEFKIEKRDNNWKTITDNRLELNEIDKNQYCVQVTLSKLNYV